jgi:hypothetical protein
MQRSDRSRRLAVDYCKVNQIIASVTDSQALENIVMWPLIWQMLLFYYYKERGSVAIVYICSATPRL